MAQSTHTRVVRGCCVYDIPKEASKPDNNQFKLLLIGEHGVGKSSIIFRFCDDSFDPHLGSTIGVDFKVKMTELRGKIVNMHIWDTAGQERFRIMASSYYRGADGVILVYDVTRKDTFEALDYWLREIDSHCPGREVVKLLVGNKIDIENEAVVSREEAEDWARSRGMLFLESSAKSNIGVSQAFEEVVGKILDNPSPSPPTNTALEEPPVRVGLNPNKNSPEICF